MYECIFIGAVDNCFLNFHQNPQLSYDKKIDYLIFDTIVSLHIYIRLSIALFEI